MAEPQLENELPQPELRWRGLYVGQTCVRLSMVDRQWPQGRVSITDLFTRKGVPRVTFETESAARLELSLESFLKEFIPR